MTYTRLSGFLAGSSDILCAYILIRNNVLEIGDFSLSASVLLHIHTPTLPHFNVIIREHITRTCRGLM